MWGDIYLKYPSERIQLWAGHGADSCPLPSEGGSWKRAVVHLFPHKDLGPPNEACGCWAWAMEGGSCPTCWTLGAPCSGVMGVQGAQQAPDQTGWAPPGVTEQIKHRRLRKAPSAPAFLLPGHLLAASEGHRIQGGGPISCSGNTAVLEMLKGKEIQGWELP